LREVGAIGRNPSLEFRGFLKKTVEDFWIMGQAKLQKLVVEAPDGPAEMDAEIETLAFDCGVFPLQPIQLAPGGASHPKENDCAAGHQENETK
jgi:hypothetical protein